MREINGQYLESENFKTLINRFKKDKKVKILQDEIEAFLQASRINEKQLENTFTSILILWAVATNNLKVFRRVKTLSLSKDKSKISQSMTEELGESINNAIEKMFNNKRAVREALKSDILDFFDSVIDDIQEYFSQNYGKGKKEKQEQEKQKQEKNKYKNEQIKKVGLYFENNMTLVYLMSLINQAKKDEINLTMTKKAIAAGYILLASKKKDVTDKIEKNIHFNQIDVKYLKDKMEKAVSFEIMEDIITQLKKFDKKLQDYENIPDEVYTELEYLVKEFEKQKQKQRKLKEEFEKKYKL